MAFAALAAQALGGITSAVGGVAQGFASSEADKYNEAVAKMNSKIALQNAAMVGQQGSSQAAIQSEKTRAEVGGIKTNEAASGVDVNSGSAVDTQVSADELGKLDAMTIRSNATKEAYGYQVQSKNLDAEAELDKFKASNDLSAGWMNGAGTLLSTIGSVGNDAAKDANAGMFG